MSTPPERDADTRAVDSVTTPADDRHLLELMILVQAQPRDRDDTGSLERAYVRRRAEDVINRHLDHLAGLGLVTARVWGPGIGGACAPLPRRAARGAASTSTRTRPTRGCSRARSSRRRRTRRLAPVHDRMPVVLAPEVLDAWLDPQPPLAKAQALCAPCLEDVPRVEPVTPAAAA